MQNASFKNLHRTVNVALAGALATVVGCAAGPGAVALSLTQFDDRLATGPTRTEVELYVDTLTAREVHVESDETINDEEYVESTVNAVTLEGEAGTLHLDLGDIAVSFDSATRFRMDGSADLSLDDFVATIQATLESGQAVFVRAERDSTGAAADPFDPTFIATEVRIEDAVDDPKLEVVLDQSNLELDGSGSGVLRVLGLEIAIATDDGTSFIEDRSGETEVENENEVEDGPGHD